MPMQPSAAVLALLRSEPATAIRAWGFIVRGAMLSNQVGGACALECIRHGNTSIYQINVGLGAGDWYIPYGHGEARYCDVPLGENDGTLVVTHPMNGCELEVRRVNGHHRFYHNADGNSMPQPAPGIQELCVTSADYEGQHQTAHERSLRYFDAEVQMNLDPPNRGGYEHTVICVKRGGEWHVFASAVIRLNDDAWQIKDRVPYNVGSFLD